LGWEARGGIDEGLGRTIVHFHQMLGEQSEKQQNAPRLLSALDQMGGQPQSKREAG
jgi:hypothetical protein